MAVQAHLIGGKILSAGDLELMNQREVKNRKYTHCTINCRDFGDYLAKVEYNEDAKVWEPTQVMVDGQWMGIDAFENSEMGESYSCEQYR